MPESNVGKAYIEDVLKEYNISMEKFFVYESIDENGEEKKS